MTVREFIQGPGETLYMPGNLAHSIMNIDENVSVTENYFLHDSLMDWIHGLMIGDTLLDEDSNGTDETKFWKAMYFRYLKRGDREELRAMINQVEDMINRDGEKCIEKEEEEDEEVRIQEQLPIKISCEQEETEEEEKDFNEESGEEMDADTDFNQIIAQKLPVIFSFSSQCE